jgi:hypothetical protein
LEQQSGPPSTGGTHDETRPTGRFTRDPGASRPEIETERQSEPGSLAEAVPDQPPADAASTESQAEATPIMSNLPRTRPQQRSEKRAAPKRPAKRRASASKPGRKAATGRSQAGTASRGRAGAQSGAGRRASASSAAAPARSSNERGVPAQAIGAAVQIASAPFKLTVAATRKAANVIGRRLGI